MTKDKQSQIFEHSNMNNQKIESEKASLKGAELSDLLNPSSLETTSDDPDSTKNSSTFESESIENGQTKKSKALIAGLAPEGLNESEKDYNREHQTLPKPTVPLTEELIYQGNYSAHNLELPRALYAGFWMRLLAFAFDIMLIFFINRILFALLDGFTANFDTTTSVWETLLRILIYCSYFTLTTLWFNGQTPGKMLFGLRVVSTSSPRLTVETIMIREFFGRIIFYYAAWIMVLLVFTDKKQHLIDLLTDTVVIQEKYLTAFVKSQAV